MKNPEFSQDFQEWLEALENTILTDGEDYTSELLKKLFQEAKNKGLDIEDIFNPPFKMNLQSMEFHACPLKFISWRAVSLRLAEKTNSQDVW